MIPSQWVDAVKHDAGDNPVVAIPGEEVAIRPARMRRDDQVGPLPADLARDVAAEGARVLELAVLVTKELHTRNPEHQRGIPRFLMADARELFGRHRAIARALVRSFE
jgi:hypothetical protein